MKGGVLKNISIKGIVIGSITDIVTTNVLTIPLVAYVMISKNINSLPKEQVSNAVMQALHNDPALFSIQILLGSLCSVLGGYIAAKIAKRNEVLNGGLACFLCVASGVYGLLFGTLTIPLWQHIAGFITSPVLSAFGGYLKKLTTRQQADA